MESNCLLTFFGFCFELPHFSILSLVLYFGIIMLIAKWTKGKDHSSFFNAGKSSPWFIVAFGMLGTTLSGVTFISVPGWVMESQFSYFQMVIGYVFGYIFIAKVLMPIYYDMNLTSIYEYLSQRFGRYTYLTGSGFFLLSRSIGAAFRLFLIALVFQIFIFDYFGLDFWIAVASALLLIWVYTFQGGIKTIVWTDTLQTFFMMLALIGSIVYLWSFLPQDFEGQKAIFQSTDFTQIFFWDINSPQYFWKQFLSGMFIAIVMTGLDQDMMQKNLTCKNLKDAQKNMYWFTGALVVVKFIFLVLGALLIYYAMAEGHRIPDAADRLYPSYAFNYFPVGVALLFIIGLSAAAYSSADSALTALTTAFCVDFLGFQQKQNVPKVHRYLVHIGFTILIFILILIFNSLDDKSVISQIFTFAGYTYGPLLGLFAFGIFTKWEITKEKWIPLICVSSPILTYLIDQNIHLVWENYKFGFELLLLNGLLCFIGLSILSLINKKAPQL